MTYEFFHWRCATCGISGGLHLSSETSRDEVMSKAIQHHDEYADKYGSEDNDFAPCANL